METVRATLIRYLKAPDGGKANGFAVVRYEAGAELVEAKMGGPFHTGITAGDWFMARGTWKSREFKGRSEENFNAISISPAMPETKRGCLQLFQSTFNERAHGINDDRMIRFIDAAGRDAAKIAERNPDVLLQMSSNPNAFRDSIFSSWGRRISARKPFLLMEKAGVDAKAVQSIIENLRDDAMRIISANPYDLAPIPNVGFPNADLIGREIGISTGDERRVIAVMSDILRAQGEAGHTYVPISGMADGLKKADVGIADIKPLVGRTAGGIVFDRVGREAVVQKEAIYKAEVSISRRIARLLERGRSEDKTEVDDVADRVLSSSKYARFDDIQKEAVRLCSRESVSILTGGPGTGKSTVTEAIAEIGAATSKGPVILLAPTGKAAGRLEETTGREAMTVHRALEAKEDGFGGSTFGRNASNKFAAGCFVMVDEASMVDTVTAAALLEAIPDDGKLLLIGDRHQLPSVGEGYVLGDLIAARSVNGNSIPCAELINVYRNGGKSMIAEGAKCLKEGTLPYMDNKERGGLIFLEHKGPNIVRRSVEVATHVAARQLNLDPRRDIAILCPQAPGLAGTWQINERMSEILNPNGKVPEGVKLSKTDNPNMPIPRIGDKVMLTKNDKDSGVMNGDIGTLTGTFYEQVGPKKGVNLVVKFDNGETVSFPVWRWRDLIPAYAITSHKSQGSQYPMVVLPVTMAHKEMLERTLLYTAWTRAKNYLVLVGEREAIEYAVSNVKSSERRTRLRAFLETALESVPPATRPKRGFSTGAALQATQSTQSPVSPPSLGKPPLRRPPPPLGSPRRPDRPVVPATQAQSPIPPESDAKPVSASIRRPAARPVRRRVPEMDPNSNPSP